MDQFYLSQHGDADAMNELVRKHMPLVQTLSKRFSWQEDAFQAGCMGLVKAIRNFDEARGVQFSTYAVPVILGEMRRASFGQMHWRKSMMLKKIRSEQEKFMQEHMRKATVTELSQRTNCPAEELVFLLEKRKQEVYDSDNQYISSAPDPDGENWMEHWMLRDMIERLTPEEKHLLRLRYKENKNQKEAAEELATSQSRVSRMENRLYSVLRCAWTENG